jgi:hypothetical protein
MPRPIAIVMSPREAALLRGFFDRQLAGHIYWLVGSGLIESSKLLLSMAETVESTATLVDPSNNEDQTVWTEDSECRPQPAPSSATPIESPAVT